MMGPCIARKAAAALGLAVLLAGFVVWLVWREAAWQARVAVRTAQTREVLATLDHWVACQADADACRCALLIRGEDDRRDRFQSAAAAARQALQQLRDRAENDPALKPSLDEITLLADQKLTLAEQSVELRKRQRFNDRRQLALTQQMQGLTEALREPLASLRARVDRDLDSQAQQGWTSAGKTADAVGVGQFLTLLVLGLSATALTRDLVAQQRAAAAAREAQKRAETRAAEQSTQLSQATNALAELSDLRGRLEEHFRQAQHLASVGRVTSEVVHDFNNLLGVILACSETTLKGLPADDPSREILGQAVKAGWRAADLMRQVRAVGKARQEPPGPRDLNAAVADMEPILRRVAGVNVEVAVSLAPNLPAVLAGSGKLEQVLLNLAANARDAMPQGGKLAIGTQLAAEARALLVVTDTGCGMDGATKKRLFEPYFTTKGEGKGTGLGMAIIHDAIQHSGGSVEVDSAPGQGTVVRIYLPLARLSNDSPPPGTEERS